MDKTKSGKSERRFHRDVNRAVENRNKKLESGRISLPYGMGKMVIVVSNNFDHRSELTPEQQSKAFHDEADRIKEANLSVHQGVEIRRRAEPLDLAMDLTDKEVTDLTLIGHGSISDFWTESGGHFGWRDFDRHTKYLKQGKITQRVCGHYAVSDSVASGTFAVTDQTNVIAPVGLRIPDINPPENLFVPVYDKSDLSAEEIIALTKERHATQK